MFDQVNAKRLVAVVLAALMASSATARGATPLADPLPLSQAEAQMLAEGIVGRLQHDSLIPAALIASGINAPAERSRLMQKYQAWLADARQVVAAQATELARAKALFELVHRRILTGQYDSRATELNRPLDAGSYNCVSATVLFTALANQCGLDVRAVERPRHAMCVLYLHDPGAAGSRIDIETTCAKWFDYTPEKRRQAEAAAIARAMAEGRAAPREIGPAGLVAVIYYNRGVDLLDDQRFAEAVSVNLRALRLDPANEIARGNLLATINNWALAECAAGRFEAATQILAQGRSAAPDHQPFVSNQRHIYRSWIQTLAADGQREQALSVLAAARKSEPGSALWSLWAQRLGDDPSAQ